MHAELLSCRFQSDSEFLQVGAFLTCWLKGGVKLKYISKAQVWREMCLKRVTDVYSDWCVLTSMCPHPHINTYVYTQLSSAHGVGSFLFLWIQLSKSLNNNSVSLTYKTLIMMRVFKTYTQTTAHVCKYITINKIPLR